MQRVHAATKSLKSLNEYLAANKKEITTRILMNKYIETEGDRVKACKKLHEVIGKELKEIK